MLSEMEMVKLILVTINLYLPGKAQRHALTYLQKPVDTWLVSVKKNVD